MAKQKKPNWKFRITIPEYEMEVPHNVKPAEIRSMAKGLNIKILKGAKI